MYIHDGLRGRVPALCVLALLSSCTGDERPGPGVPDGGRGSAADSGTDGGGEVAEDSATGDASPQAEEEFWDYVAVCGEWVEQFDAIDEMADAADAVVVGAITGVTSGYTIQGDAPEDFYVEVNLIVEVEEVLRHTIGDELELSLILPRVVTPSAVAPAIAAMQERLPPSPVLLLLRKREDLGTDNLYRLVNDRGLWTETTPGALDAPIIERGPSCMGHDEDLDTFVGAAETLAELIGALRQ